MAPTQSTYSGDPNVSTRDAIRCLVGDIGGESGSSFLLTDAEVDYFDSVVAPVFGDPLMTAAICADILAGRFALEVTIAADGVSIAAEQLQQKFSAMAATLRQTYKTLASVGGYPQAGGIDAFTVPDPTIKAFNFAIGMNDNYRAGSQSTLLNPEDWWYAQFDSEPW